MSNAIKLNDKKTVYLTDNAYSVKTGVRNAGDAIERHPKQAKALVEAGKATTEPPKTAKTSK